MKEQAQMMNQQQHQQKMMSMNQHQPHQPQQQVMKPPLIPKQPPLSSSQNPITMNNHPVYANNYLKNPQSNNLQMMMMNQPPPPLMNRSYGLWPPPLPPSSSAPIDPMKFQNPNPNLKAGGGGGGGSYLLGGKQQQQHLGLKPLGPRSNWKGKKYNDKRKDGRRNENINMSLMAGSSSGGSVGGVGYTPPTLNELQHQNRVKARRFFTKKKFHPYPYHHNNNNNNNGNNRGKFAPRNTSSFIIRAKKSGGIAELVSPCPVTPAVLPTPMFSPSREVLVDMAKEEWGVDGYGSMKGLIRLRSPGREDEGHEGDEEDEEGGSSESDVEEHVEVERRLDHDLNRFEMIYPSYAVGMDYNNVLENRVDDQDTHIAQLEEENLILKERLFLMEREFGELRRRLQCLERQTNGGGEEINEEVMENESDNDSESGGEAHSVGDNIEEFIDENTGHGDVKEKEETTRDNNEEFVEENMRHGYVEGKEEATNLEHEVNAAKSVDGNDANDKEKDENDDGASEMKDENMGEDAVVKEDTAGKVENEERIDEEVNVGGSEIAAVGGGGDISMEEVVGQAENDNVVIAENHSNEN